MVYFCPMKESFFDYHIQTIFQNLSESNKPLDLLMSEYFRAHKNLGSTDRRVIGDTVYGMVRWKSLIDHFSPDDRIAFYRSINWGKVTHDDSIPVAARLGLPEYVYSRFCTSFGKEQAHLLGQILNQPAPTTIRVNLLKTSREKLLHLLENRYSISRCNHSLSGIRFSKREPLFTLAEFKEGLFEIQDEGSQLITDLVEAKPGDCVLDFCSGSGGKTLGFAHRMQGKGQIYLHDIRSSALLEARRRLKRAGIQNAQCIPTNHPQLARLIGKCDWVLIDVPCSGTGTLRRNPDQKWKINERQIEQYIGQQRTIARDTFKYLKPGGRLVYATCSLLPEENLDQVHYILKNLPLTLEKTPLSLFPQPGGMDGFFCAVLKK